MNSPNDDEGSEPSTRDRVWGLLVVLGIVAIAALMLYLSFGPRSA